MENVIIELQLELRAARDEAELKRKKSQQSTSTKNLFNFSNRKINSPTTPTNTQNEDIDTQMRPIDASFITDHKESSNLLVENINKKTSNDFIYSSLQSSRRSSHSTNTDDDQYELVRHLSSTNNNEQNQITTEIKDTSSPEMVSSATSLSSTSSNDENESKDQTIIKIENDKTSITYESGRFEPVKMTTEQANLLEEASRTE
ncbi:unnamed protein product [Rotaria sp. Silwood2]|nr:unnamed protein product [Rotaria sp. Silwood2]CAF3194727.1 unnamed protein product [Rotaria sp. Silwood2]CAF3321184.1 unnamed protein product [Rotaria sp. Silwood2]CAF3403595.1 unnamed protein product [Rotaria sp. Silwood2]CAF3985664.1 unnamed protein product [Rotaria sp. Silwood2]